MPTEIIVHPGDLITADLWNKLLDSIDSVSTRIDAMEARAVPDVVGALLPAAVRDIIASGLTVAKILDTAGTSVDSNDPAVADRFVLVQMPSPEDRVRIGRRVELLITPPRVKTANAPDITAVAAVGGGEPHVGGGIIITGTAFAGNIRVSIGRNELAPPLFTVNSPTQITVPAVPSFPDQPAPGTSRPVAIEVSNEIGRDVFSRSFFEPGFIAVRPFISNVRFNDLSIIHLFGSNLFQRNLDVSVTVGGEKVNFKPTGEELDVALPDALSRSLQKSISATLLKPLLRIDQRDLFLINNLQPSVIVDPVNPNVKDLLNVGKINTIRGLKLTPTPAANISDVPISRAANIAIGEATPATQNPGDQLPFFEEVPNDPGKLFLILPQQTAETVAGDPNARVEPQRGGALLVSARGVQFAVIPTKVPDVPIVVTVGDKSDTFLLKIGQAGG